MRNSIKWPAISVTTWGSVLLVYVPSLGRATSSLGPCQSLDCENIYGSERPPSLAGIWGLDSANALAVCKGTWITLFVLVSLLSTQGTLTLSRCPVPVALCLPCPVWPGKSGLCFGGPWVDKAIAVIWAFSFSLWLPSVVLAISQLLKTR